MAETERKDKREENEGIRQKIRRRINKEETEKNKQRRIKEDKRTEKQ